ncbi:MAG TPA: MFS transporter [Steroidobacteraceae bacterium]
MRRLLTQHSFLVLLVGSIVNQVGSQVTQTATVFWLRNHSDAAALLGLSATFGALPMLLLSPLGGVYADRWPRRKILFGSYIVSCLVCIALAGLSNLLGLPNMVIFVGLFVAKIMLSSCTAFGHPAMDAFVTDVVEPQQINQAMGLVQTLTLPATIGGQALGALLLDQIPLPLLFLIDGATYIACAASLAFVTPIALTASGQSQRKRKGIYEDLSGAADYIWRRPGMRLVLLGALPATIFTETILVFLPVYATNTLHIALSHYAYLTASYSAGLSIGYLAVTRELMPRARRSAVVTCCVFSSAVFCMGLALNHSYGAALVLLLLFGLSSGAIALLCLNEMLAQTAPDKRGRISAALLMITQGLTPLAMSLLGVAVDQLSGNVLPVYCACSLAFALLGLISLSSRNLQSFFAPPSLRSGRP